MFSWLEWLESVALVGVMRSCSSWCYCSGDGLHNAWAEWKGGVAPGDSKVPMNMLLARM